MKSNVDPELLEKLGKILRLANGRGATPGEVEAAMGKAKALALKHNIDLAMVSLEDPNAKKSINIEVGRVDVGIRSKRFQTYHRYIFWTLSDVFGVQVVLFHTSFCFIGEATDVVICKELFPWLEDVFCTTYSKARSTGMLDDCAADKRGVYEGLFLGISKANKREEAKLTPQEQSGLALVVRSKEVAIAARTALDFPKLKSHKSRATESNSAAMRYGFEKGQQINLAQTGAPKAHSQLSK